MELKILKEELHDLYEDNKIKECFFLLKAELKRAGNSYATFISIKRRFNALLDQKVNDTIDFNTRTTETNKIGKSLLDFIETLKEVDLATEYQSTHAEIENSIAVFTAQDRMKKVQDFFKLLNFKNVSVIHTKDFSNTALDSFDLVIFDNRDLPACFSKKILESLDLEKKEQILNRIKKMNDVINGSAKFIIHYGEFLYWINSNRERVQAANSKFSLYARTKEVIEFINTYRV
ncbi:MAG: hypothetical protein AB8G15_05570 [Saprospiraceae bacterium]